MTYNTNPVQALIGQWRDAAEFFRGDAGADIRETLRACARELEAALSQQPAETSNARGEWVLVPVKPTEAMREAFHDWRPSEGGNYAGAQSVNCQVRWEFRQRYAAMLAAAPSPAAAPQQPAGVGGEE